MKEASLTSSTSSESDQAVVLFYQYFALSSSSSSPPDQTFETWWKDAKRSVETLHDHQQRICTDLNLTGRVLIAEEGINGTVAGSRDNVEAYIHEMKKYHHPQELLSNRLDDNNKEAKRQRPSDGDCLFRNVDWKTSFVKGNKNVSGNDSVKPLFPDLKICIVKEIVSTGGLVDVHDIPVETGRHLSPEEFHEMLTAYASEENHGKVNDNTDNKLPPIALIDVRNTFEHNIGHFVNPQTGEKALNPEMTTFSSFDKFCQQHADDLKDKQVLMYCTGGIRCEKASVMLKRKGVNNVAQLSGGIHRYLERYGKDGFFKGLNFTFDKRVAIKPDMSSQRTSLDDGKSESSSKAEYEVVGTCVECTAPFDELDGSRVCTVCRDLVLVCCDCQSSLLEYHCSRHAAWKDCYFSFLEVFDSEQLCEQKLKLEKIRESLELLPNTKNTRRALARQIDKVEQRISELDTGKVTVQNNAPRRCRSCLEPNGVCDGRCWGFWKASSSSSFTLDKGIQKGRRSHQCPL
ncbi:hypothetical protein IV203_000406 [Nitzschia inconspicua]|uniref:Rhodanese domain-containing protein n=1 Tax=Nitzschia inconspicua TaxID=303405 RepID=A0A9K3PPY7_9STRA|nr:hypothetical protein IV203_000406 [Nitzschia inconspicua]